MQLARHVATSQPMILVGTTALSFEVVESFIHTAEKARRNQPIVLYTLLQAARNRESIRVHDDLVPEEHVWMTSEHDEAVALLLGPIFYRMKIGDISARGVPLPREGALDMIRFESATHREMLRLVIQGAH